MTDDISDIAALYDQGVEREDERLERHQLEYDLTWRFLTHYLPPSGSILEIGAATGRYTAGLCKLGYSVTAVDLSAALLARCRERLAAEGLLDRAQLVVADARDLQAVPGTGFDAVLLMGPLYHLVFQEDRIQALRQALERLREGGLLFSAFISRLGILGDVMKDIPEWIERREEVRWLLAHGRRPNHGPRGGFRAYFAQVSEIAPLHEALGVRTLALAAVEPAISADDESYNRLQGRQREWWLDLLYQVSTEESIVGASRHLLYIGRKAAGDAVGATDEAA